jgi:ABC-type multidrug transport system permease subunit
LIVRAPVPSGAAGAGGAHGDAGGVEYRYDESRAEGRLARLAADDVLQRARGRADALAVAEDAAPPPGSRYVDYLFPGVLGMNIMMSSLWGMGYAIVVGRKLKLLRRLAVTPMRRRDFLLSYFLSRALLLVVEALVILVFGALAFGVEMRGSLVALTVVSAAGAAAFAALALVVASRTDNLDAANGLLNAVALPMWMASGTFFSYERFPEIVHPLIRALPLTALNDALRAIANEGASLGSTWSELLVLAAWTVAGFLAASRLFRWQ